MPEWLTVDEAAAYLKVGRATIYKWCQRGLLRYYQLPTAEGRRFNREDLDKLVQPGGQHAVGRRRAR